MQLGLVRHLVVAFSVFVVLSVSGCGQKGPLYRDAPSPVGSVSDSNPVSISENASEGADKP